MSTAPFIRCADVHKRFGEKQVLRGITLDVPAGETVVILGGSGSGKSVLLKHMNALLQPDAGDVLVEGASVARLPERALSRIRRRIAMLFQMGALFDSLTVGENVAYGLREHHVLPDADVPASVRECLAMVELAGTEQLMPAELSGGMRKRVALARSLALGPAAILYDEPTTGLDPVVASKINQLIRDLQRKLRITSVAVTHDLASAFFVADRIAFLHDGRIRFHGTPAEARASHDPVLREFLAAA